MLQLFLVNPIILILLICKTSALQVVLDQHPSNPSNNLTLQVLLNKINLLENKVVELEKSMSSHLSCVNSDPLTHKETTTSESTEIRNPTCSNCKTLLHLENVKFKILKVGNEKIYDLLKETKVHVQNTTKEIIKIRNNYKKITSQLKGKLNNTPPEPAALGFKFLEMETKYTEIRKFVNELVDGLKTEITELKTNLNKSINLMTLSIKETNRLISQPRIFAELGQTMGHTSSFNETGKQWDIQDRGCGGIVVAENGLIQYESLPKFLNPISKVCCVWTIRANRRSAVDFKLTADNLELVMKDSFLQIKAPTSTVEFTRDQNGTYPNGQMMTSNLNKETRVKGPVVFVTLITDSHTTVKFNLTFRGEGEDTSQETMYSHFHFREALGSLEYPNIRGAVNYSSNEFATFVINPLERIGNLRIKTEKLDIEYQKNCKYDNLVHIEGKTTNENHYSLVESPSNYRRCGGCNSTNTCPTIGGGWNTDNIISIFTSDSDHEQTGFKLNWTS